MAAGAISNSDKKRFLKDPALAFINGIDSTWKGHEPFIIWLVQYLKPKTILDLGFDRGLSTIVFAYKNKGQVFGVDWFDEGNYAVKSFALDSGFRNISNAIRFNYAKNIHLFVGPFKEIAKTWNKKIDLLHIDWAHSYASCKQHYENWSRYLTDDGVVLVHDVTTFPNETGRFFAELPFHKLILPNGQGMGIATNRADLIEEIRARFLNA